MKLKKLDARNKGFGSYKYMAIFRNPTDQEKFCKIRNWCWEQWGPSSELDFRKGKNELWAWLTNEFEVKIYIATDKEYQWFLLKWQ